MIPAFTAVTEVELTVPCTCGLEVASARYLQGLDDGTIPLLMLFSGTVFVATDALAGFKRRHALPTWDATLAELLARAGDNESAAAPDRNGEPEVEGRTPR